MDHLVYSILHHVGLQTPCHIMISFEIELTCKTLVIWDCVHEMMLQSIHNWFMQSYSIVIRKCFFPGIFVLMELTWLCLFAAHDDKMTWQAYPHPVWTNCQSSGFETWWRINDVNHLMYSLVCTWTVSWPSNMLIRAIRWTTTQIPLRWWLYQNELR